MEEYGIKIIYGFFAATVLLALATACYQYFHDRNRIYLLSILYWFSILASSAVNAIVENVESYYYIISVFATYCSQTVLAYVICETRGVKYSPKYLNYFFIAGYIIAEFFRFMNLPFELYITLAIFVSVAPVFYSLWLIFTQKNNKFTSAQKLFYFFCLILALHYLDYAFFKSHSHLFAYASAIAFLILHVLSTLMPMVVNEYALYVKNKNLEHEVEQRVVEIRSKDLQLWESNKLEVLGRFSGLLAHELNTPLCAVSLASTSIKKSLLDEVVDKTKILDKVDKIKKILDQIIQITTTLRSASGDLKKENLYKLNLNQFFMDEANFIDSFCAQSDIEYRFQTKSSNISILGNKNELSQVLRTLILNSMKFTDTSSAKPWIQIDLEKEDKYCFLKYSDSRPKNQSMNSNMLNNDLDLIVIKSIIENHQAKMDFDFNSPNQKVIFKFPLITED